MVSKNQIKLITSLQQKKFRQLHKLFIAEGVKVIQELLDSNFVLEHLFVRLILFARMISRMAAPLLILVDGCHAESLSNEQGQELHKNLITCYNDMAQ